MKYPTVFAFFLVMGLLCKLQGQAVNVKITIHLRGIYESNITILHQSDSGIFAPLTEVQGLKNGLDTTLVIPKDKLPGEFVIRFDYRDKKANALYPSEKRVIVNNQDLELWVSPAYCNNSDSTWFNKGEKENSAFASFNRENIRQKKNLEILEEFLMTYGDTNSEFYQKGIKEYTRQRKIYNNWLQKVINQDKDLFASRFYQFNYVPEVLLAGSETDRINSRISHYFDGIDLTDPVITKTSVMKSWMDDFVNLHGQMATTKALQDSLIPAAALAAVQKAMKGHPLVYGWMVDYFYRGFESNNMPDAMKILEPFLEDPRCLTSKKAEIQRRLTGMETLVIGSKAPDFILQNGPEGAFELNSYRTPSRYTLLLFWSAGCSHCMETMDVVYPWCSQPEVKKNLSVVAISLDETEAEIQSWNLIREQLKGWIHLRAEEGVKSKIAGDYFILATPVMILIDSETKEIMAMPESLAQLSAMIR